MVTTIAHRFEVQIITITVSNLETSRQFYEGVLGFKVKSFYEPTRWVSYHCEGGGFFAVIEAGAFEHQANADEVDFYVESVAEIWKKLQGRVQVKEPLGFTPWDSGKFVILDPDGYSIGFVQHQAGC